MSEFKFDVCIEQPSVVCGSCALARLGLTTGLGALELLSRRKVACNIQFCICTYRYTEYPINYEVELTRCEHNPNLLMPSRERALVECMREPDIVDEGDLIEALQTYMRYFNIERVYEFAERYGVDKDIVDYWVREAREYKNEG